MTGVRLIRVGEVGYAQRAYQENKQTTCLPEESPLYSARCLRDNVKSYPHGWDTQEGVPRCERHLRDGGAVAERLAELMAIRSSTFVPTATVCQRIPEAPRYLASLGTPLYAQRLQLRSD